MSTTDFDAFYSRHMPLLIKHASTYVSNSAAANDIAFEAMNEYWLRRDNFENERAALAFLNVCIRNKSINYIRHVKSRIQTKDNAELIQEYERVATPFDSFSNEIATLIANILSSLSPKTVRIFRMAKYERLKHAKIAEIENISIKGVEYHIKKAKNALRSGLSEHM